MAAADVTVGLVVLGIATLVLLVLVVYVLVKMKAIASRSSTVRDDQNDQSNVERRLDDLQRLGSLQMQTQDEVAKILAGHSQAIRSLQSQVRNG